ncbi:CaiB/BaiF CoA transferase family protein [Oligoflexus tunisiensis]|uniref:CaiB/BaiF CoA transferase family protein n=1 Tax=Oligoflexus tunisiensis TaxID=708132 RepID=UPI000A94B1DC|nr:CoA transferase [Oligoflexus tunisiensis]
MQPFSQLKVLDFTTLLPGPFATMYLADWGADILRVEAPDREDLTRAMPPFAHGVSTAHAFLNRSKKSITLDLKEESARQTIKDLIQDYDVVVEQFRPGVMARFGLDYKALSAINPRLIYCSLTGYGQTGPYANRAGHDINYAALSGLAAMTGSRAGGPVIHGDPVCDLAGSFHTLIGLLTALYHRERTGEGQAVDISMTDSSLMLSGMWLSMGLGGGQFPSWEGTALNGGSFYGYYKTSDGKYLSVGSLEPKFLRGFLEAIEALDLLQGDLTRPDFMMRMRIQIQERIQRKTLEAWLETFSKLDVCVEPVLTLDQVVRHPQFQARQMFVDVPAGKGASQKQLASPLKFSSFQPIYRFIGAAKGADNSLLKE